MEKGIRFFWFIIVLMFTPGEAIQAQEACREAVKKALHEKVASDPDQLDMEYRIGTWLPGVDTAQYQQVRVTVANGITRVQSQDMTYVKNEKISLRIFHDLKTIHLTGAPNMDIVPHLSGFRTLYDSLLSKAKIIECYDHCDGENDQQIIQFGLPQYVAQRFAISHFSYKLTNGELNSIIVEYMKGHLFQKLELELFRWDTSGSFQIAGREWEALKDPDKITLLFPEYQLINAVN